MAYRKIQVSKKDFETIKKNQIFNNNIVFEQNKGSRRNLYDKNNKLIATTIPTTTINIGNLNKQKFLAFIGLFNKTLYNIFISNPSLYDQRILFKGVSRRKNEKQWNLMKNGEIFYNVDLDSAYWQILYKLGYIERSFFEQYRLKEDYKQIKRLCVSFLSRKNSKTYYYDGVLTKIYCDNNVLQTVYQNIRNTLYNIINEVCQETSYIAYNIDSVYIKPSDMKKLKEVFDKYDLDYKFTLCQKKTLGTYQFGKETRKF